MLIVSRSTASEFVRRVALSFSFPHNIDWLSIT